MSELGRPLSASSLREAYHGEGMSLSDIGDEVDRSPAWVSKKMDELGVETRSRKEATRMAVGVDRARFRTRIDGYESWRAWNPEREQTEEVLVHRLAAVAWYGWDAVIDNDAHHDNNCSFDNREANVLPMDPKEHRELHKYAGVEAHV